MDAKASAPQRSLANLPAGAVVLLCVDDDGGCRYARELLAAGYRVVVTCRCVTELPRIMHGHRHDQILALAADCSDRVQFGRVISRAQQRFGGIDAVIDPGSISQMRSHPTAA